MHVKRAYVFSFKVADPPIMKTLGVYILVWAFRDHTSTTRSSKHRRQILSKLLLTAPLKNFRSKDIIGLLPSLKDVMKHELDWIGKTWTGLIKHGVIKHGLIKHGVINLGLIKHGVIKHHAQVN